MANVITGNNNYQGGFNYLVTVYVYQRRAKRKGRNPSTNPAFAPNSQLGIVNRSYCMNFGKFGNACVHIKMTA